MYFSVPFPYSFFQANQLYQMRNILTSQFGGEYIHIQFTEKTCTKFSNAMYGSEAEINCLKNKTANFSGRFRYIHS